jgi:hypothetical protein
MARMVAGGGSRCLASGALVAAAAPVESSEEESEETESKDDESEAVVQSRPPPAYVLPAPAAPNDQMAAPPVEWRIISPDRVPWIVPPAILPNWVGKWEKWELIEVQDDRAWVFRGKKAQLESRCWYD